MHILLQRAYGGNMVSAMEEPEVVAAIVAGDPTGLAEALDMYATSLFAYCRSIFSQAEAAETVQDTFIIACARLDGLRDPGQLGRWLHAVARNECRRRLFARGERPSEPVAVAPEVTFPQALRGELIRVCTDDTPAGRARRTSVVHRAGPFGRDGYPKPVSPPRRRSPRLAVAATAFAAVTGIAAVVIIVVTSGPHPDQAAATSLTGQGAAGAASPSPAGTSSTGGTGTHASPKATHEAAARVSAPPSGITAAPATPASTPGHTPAASSPDPPASPAGELLVAPSTVSLVSVDGKRAATSFTLTASGGPVAAYSVDVTSSPGHLFITPTAGALSAGGAVTISVSARAARSFTASITVYPGGQVVTVQVMAER
jgi:hypothetical protein